MNSVSQKSNQSVWSVLTVIALLILAASELLFQYSENPVAKIIGRCFFVVLCISLFPSFKFREWALVAIAGALSIGLYPTQSGWEDILGALDRAAFFGAFIYLVTLLKEAAASSPSVLELGKYLTKQPAGRRFYSIAFGGHLMGVLLNFGAISLLTPLIQMGAKSGGDAKVNATLEQQQISALLRGFPWMFMWSPTALTQAILFTAFPTIDLVVVMSLGITATVVLIFLGRLEDRIRWRNIVLPTQSLPPEFPRQSVIRFSIICVTLVALTIGVINVAHVSAAIALMLIAPIVMVVWLVEQEFQKTRTNVITKTATHLRKVLSAASQIQGTSAVTLGIAGFIGEAAAKLAPVDLLAHSLEVMHIPSWALLISLPIIIMLCGQIALSPILVVVFLSSVLNQLPVLPADPNLIVFALGAGWALSMTSSPNASATLMMSGVSGIAPTTLTWKWNGAYALMCLAAFSLAFIVLDYLF